MTMVEELSFLQVIHWMERLTVVLRILWFGTTWCCAPSQFFLTALLELATEGIDGLVNLELVYVNHRSTHPEKDPQNTQFLGAHPWGTLALPPQHAP